MKKSDSERTGDEIQSTATAGTETRKVSHPFRIRPQDEGIFSITSPTYLIGAGFASFGVGMFTLFRPGTLILCTLVFASLRVTSFLEVYKTALTVTLGTWLGLLVAVLFGLGCVQTLSGRITSRRLLLLHPWGLLLLYLDVFVWLSLTLWLHIKSLERESVNVVYLTVVLSYMYLEVFIFFLCYYAYATYFIATELTVVKTFF